jgi:hypothetical protein
MSSGNTPETFELKIQFEQVGEDNVSWIVLPDATLDKANRFDLIELAEMGAPLAALGLMILWKQCQAGILNSTLNMANMIRNEALVRLAQRSQSGQSIEANTGLAEEVVIH